MQSDHSQITTDLVLVGGGHSHLFVLKYFAMNPRPGLRITLVTRDLHTPYSGMLPGFIAGHYAHDEAHIDLQRLARFAGVRIIHAEVVGIDADRRTLEISGRPALDYDLLSINIGSRPGSPILQPGSTEAFAVKPVDRFIESWTLLEQLLAGNDKEFDLAVVGGGAGAVELTLSLQYRLRGLCPGSNRINFKILTDEDRLLTGHNSRVQRMFREILAQRGIQVYYQHRVESFSNGALQGNFDPAVSAQAAIWATGASPAPWLESSGLDLDDRGFIVVNSCLQSISHEDVFAAGDIASVAQYPRPRSGVFAVRQGLPLARNLLRRVEQQPLRAFKPQRHFLSLISTGDCYAVASRGPWASQGKWWWWLKDRIDRSFMRRFSDLPLMQATASSGPDIAPMRCGGCGSKVGSGILEPVLKQIVRRYELDAGTEFDYADDAALIEVPAGLDLIQSIDHFSSFIDDPYLFGRIAANHALGDMHAMGVQAHSAMVIANLVYGSEARQSADLYQLMSGVVETLLENDTRLIGGHSGEAAQMSCGLSVNGFGRVGELMLKSGLKPGQHLVLTRALGSGVLFAADMRGQARGEWIDHAIEQMLVSNRKAASCLQEFGVRACTDITGFGLAGHLYEMLRASSCDAELELTSLPLYPGAIELAGLGVESSLQPQNIRVRHSIQDTHNMARHAAYPLLFDPQTAGGLLVGIEAAQVDQCLQRLHDLGYDQSTVIGRVVERAESGALIRLSDS